MKPFDPRFAAILMACVLSLGTLVGCSSNSHSSSLPDTPSSAPSQESPQEPESSAPPESSSRAEEPSQAPAEESSQSSAQAPSAPPESSSSQPESSSSLPASSSQVLGETPSSQPADQPAQTGTRSSEPYVYTPVSSGTTTYSGGNVKIDASNTAEGYVMVKYSGSNSKVKLQIAKESGTTYTYDLKARGSYEVFPFTEGNGSYTVNVYENLGGTSYALAFGQKVTVSLRNSLLPFLYPNQYVNFSAKSTTVEKGAELAEGANTDLDVVSSVYNFVIKNISYDFNLANSISSGTVTSYLPSVDNTLSSKKGICFDYAAIMTAMLRSQNIPTRLEVGWAGEVYHAWISTYITDVGWINGIIYFDGKSWKLMDPTFASSGNSSDSIMKFIGNGSNYSRKYLY